MNGCEELILHDASVRTRQQRAFEHLHVGDCAPRELEEVARGNRVSARGGAPYRLLGQGGGHPSPFPCHQKSEQPNAPCLHVAGAPAGAPVSAWGPGHHLYSYLTHVRRGKTPQRDANRTEVIATDPWLANDNDYQKLASLHFSSVTK